MKKNTLIIIVITAVMLFLGGTALFFGYKCFTVDNKCEKVKCNNNVNDGNNDNTTNNNGNNNKKNCNCPTETKKANNMTDEEILDNISTKTHNFSVNNNGGLLCTVKSDVLSLNGVLSSQNEAQNLNHKIMDYTMVLRGNLLASKTECQANGGKEECNDCEYSVKSEYAVVNGIVTINISYYMQDKKVLKFVPTYFFYDVKNDEIIKMGDAMRLMGVTDLGGAKSYEDLNKGCGNLTITNHNKVTISNYRDQCA